MKSKEIMLSLSKHFTKAIKNLKLNKNQFF